MSEEVSNSTEVELELGQLSDELEGTSLDGSDLVALIREANAKTGKDEGPENAIASVKAALQNESVSIPTLMECEDLLPVLISGLKTDSSKVQLDVIQIVALIFKEGTDEENSAIVSTKDPHKERVIGSGMIPALIRLLPSEDETVCEKALHTLRLISTNYASLDYFRNSDIIPALIQLGERTEEMQWLVDIAWIAGQFCHRRGINWDEPPGRVGKAEPWMLPSLSVVQGLLQLLLILMKGSTSTDESAYVINVHIGLVAYTIAEVEGSFGMILASGIVPLIADLLGSSDENVRLAAGLGVSEIFGAVKSDEEILQFFQALKGSAGMKELWRNIFEMNDTSDGDKENRLTKQKCSAQLDRFLNKVRKALERERRPTIIEAMIQSGFVHTLVKFLEKEAPFEPQVNAMFMLEIMMRETGEKNVDLFLEMGVVPLLLEQLKNKSDRARLLAPVCLRDLMKANGVVRDEIVSRGGLHQMIQMLRKENKKNGVATGLLICFDEILRQTPKLPLEQFNGLAESLKVVWGNIPRLCRKKTENRADITTRIFSCVRRFADYGTGGIELLRTSGCFGVLIGGLSSEVLGVQLSAMEMIVHAALLKQENREVLLRLGVLDSFPTVFRNPLSKVIQLVLICLKVFLDGKLSIGQTKAILGLKSFVEAELLRDIQITSRAASMLLSRMGEIEK